jgi:hypothetical protein
MVISRAFIQNRAIGIMKSHRAAWRMAVLICAAGMAASGHATAAPLPKSYAAPCADSDEFAFAQQALILAKQDLTAKRYHAASRRLETATDKLDDYRVSRIFAAGEVDLDDTGQHMSLANFFEMRGNLKRAIYLKKRLLLGTMASCKREPRETLEKLRKRFSR